MRKINPLSPHSKRYRIISYPEEMKDKFTKELYNGDNIDEIDIIYKKLASKATPSAIHYR